MKNSKFFILYKKELKTYLIINSENHEIFWEMSVKKQKDINKNNKYIKISKKMNNYLIFLLNISIFGLCPINNNKKKKKK